jgi:chromosome segregation ATPase
MNFFSPGNLLTLGIVVLVLILFRQLDRNNRSLDKMRKYGERLKEELTEFVAQKEAAVRDYGVDLDVRQKQAKELMNRIRTSDESLTAKVDLVNNLNENLKTYDSSLGELVRMTVKVQENLSRIQHESSFVEGVDRRLSEAREKIVSLEKGFEDFEFRFERENAASLEKVSASLLESTRSAVSDLQAAAETIERQVEEHREAVNRIEQEREANLERDRVVIEKILQETTERAENRANKMEEAALVKLRDQATERVQRFQTVVEEKLRVYQESGKAWLTDIQNVARSVKDEWTADHADLEEKQRVFKEAWQRDIQSLLDQIQAVKDLGSDSERKAAEFEGRLQSLDIQTVDAVAQMRRQLTETIEEEGQKALEAAEARLAEYREAQQQEFERLGTLAEDADKLDGELRRHMQETEDRVRRDFSRFEQETAERRAAAASEFAVSLESLRGDVSAIDNEIAQLKEKAYNTVSDNMKLFEEDFSADLSRRREEFDLRISKWKDALDADLAELGEAFRKERREMEISLGEDLKRYFADEDARLVADLEHLKAEAAAFEEEIRNQMARADESLGDLKNQLDTNMTEARDTAEVALKAELSRFSLDFAELLKQQQRELEGEIKKIASRVETRSGEFAALLDGSQQNIEEWQTKFSGQMRSLDDAVEEYRRKFRDLAAENEDRLAVVLEESLQNIEEWQTKFSGQMRSLDDAVEEYRRKFRDLAVENEDRLAAVRSSIENLSEETAVQRNEAFAHADEHAGLLDSAVKDADRRIKEFLAQTKLFDQAEELKSALEQKLEDLRGDLNGLDQRRAEAAELEAKFIKIKRLEEAVDAKMVSFQSEKRRIELMENDFNRLLQTSQSVKEKLAEVTASDDALQTAQVQIRRLTDALGDAEERYERIEKKNQTLEETNAGIDDNFKALQESERAARMVQDEIRRLLGQQEEIRLSVEKLFAENAQAQETAERLSALDGLLDTIEARMAKLQIARESLARAETRFEDINKSLQEQYKLFTALLRNDGPDRRLKEPGAPPIGVRENVIKLKQQGWKVEEIAPIVKLSVGEVELILEMGSKI